MISRRNPASPSLICLLAAGTLFIAGHNAVSEGGEPAHAAVPLAKTAGGFPSRPVRILVPTSPGGLIDTTARKFAAIATEKAGVPFIVINKPGAGGVVSFEETLRAPSDGGTLQAVTRSNVPKLVAAGRTDLLDSVYWAAKLLDDPQCVIVNKNSPLPNWQSVLSAARESPGRQLWLGPDIGGLDHVSAARIWAAAGIEARWIPYESGGQAIAALLGGMGATYTGNPSEVRGRPDLTIAAVCSSARLPQFPDAPTFAELGLHGLEEESMWRGFALHPATPPQILAWYAQLFAAVTNDARWRDEWEKEGISVVYVGEPDFRSLVQRETASFTAFLREEGILPDPHHPVPVVNPPLVHLLLGASMFFYVAWVLILGRRNTRFWQWSATSMAVFSGLALSFFLISAAGKLPGGNPDDPLGPAGIPLLWCSILLLCMLAMGWSEWRHLRAGESAAAADSPDATLLSLGLAGILLLGVALFPYAGYYLATLILLPLALRILGWKNFPVSAIVALGWLAFVFFVFQQTLHVDLPLGPLASPPTFAEGPNS